MIEIYTLVIGTCILQIVTGIPTTIVEGLFGNGRKDRKRIKVLEKENKKLRLKVEAGTKIQSRIETLEAITTNDPTARLGFE